MELFVDGSRSGVRRVVFVPAVIGVCVAATVLCAASGDCIFLVCECSKERIFWANVTGGDVAWLVGSCVTVRWYLSKRSRPPLMLTHLFFPSGETVYPSRGLVVTLGDKGVFVAIMELLCITTPLK